MAPILVEALEDMRTRGGKGMSEEAWQAIEGAKTQTDAKRKRSTTLDSPELVRIRI